jgi:thioredoxin 1
MIAPILEDISNTENVKIYKLNVDDNQDIATEYEVMTIPSLISFKNGEVLKRIVGLSSKEEILELAE